LTAVIFVAQSRENGMDFPRALNQIEEIHQQIAKGEIYRGYRSAPVAASGLVGIAAALVQPASGPAAFVQYWTVVAAIAALVGISEIAYNYVVHDDASTRRRTRKVLGQFLPAVAAAAVLTATFSHLSPTLAPALPGVWAICFGLGTFASRPYLPRTSDLVALYYFAAGTVLLWTLKMDAPPSGWSVGGTFGAGQLLAAAVLYWEFERRNQYSGARAR
jgi:hypothetical protein